MSYVSDALIDAQEREIKKLKDENAKLRHVARELWILFLKHAAVSQIDLPKVDEVRETLYGLEIKVD